MNHAAGQPAVLFVCVAEDLPAIRGISQRLRTDGVQVRILADLPADQQVRPHSLRAALQQAPVVVAALSRRSIAPDGSLHDAIRRLIDIHNLMPQRRPLVVLKLARVTTPASIGEDETVELFGYSGYEQLNRILQERTSLARVVAAAPEAPPAARSSAALRLSGRFGPPEYVRHGFIRRLGRGVARAVYPLDARRILLITGGGATLLDLRSNAPLWSIDNPTRRGVLSRERRLLALADLDRITVWDLQDGRALAQCIGHDGPINGMAFSNDERTLFSCGNDGTLRLWRLDAGVAPATVALAAFSAHPDAINCLALSPDGSMIATGGADRMIRIWRSLDRSLARAISGHGGAVEALAFSPDGSLLAGGSRDRSLRLYDTRHWVLRHTLDRHSAAVEHLAFSPDGSLLASGATDQSVRLWQVADGTPLHTLNGHSAALSGLGFAPDGTTLASVAEDERLILWDSRSGEQINSLRPLSGRITAMALDAGGTTLAIGSADGATVLYPTNSDAPPQTRYEDHRGAVGNLAFNADGRLISTAADRTVRACRIGPEPNNSLILLQIHGAFQSSALSPDGQLVASSDGEQTVQLWKIAADQTQPGGTFLRVLRGLSSRPKQMVFAPQGAALAVLGEDQRVAVWRLVARSPRDSADLHLSGEIGPIGAIAFSPDGLLLAAGGLQGGAQIWRLTDGAPIRMPGAIGAIRALAFSPDGRSLAAGDTRGMIAIWRLAANERRRSSGPAMTISAHAGSVTQLCFMPGDGTLISGSSDGSARMWRV